MELITGFNVLKVRNKNVWFYSLTAGVRQGGVLFPFLFAVFIDSVVNKVKSTNVGCYISATCCSIFLYADDILMIAPSVSALQILLNACEEELLTIDVYVNKIIDVYSFW